MQQEEHLLQGSWDTKNNELNALAQRFVDSFPSGVVVEMDIHQRSWCTEECSTCFPANHGNFSNLSRRGS